MNRFFEWIGLKEKLHRSEHKPPFVSERDLWWTSLGENIGSEVNGKSDRFFDYRRLHSKIGQIDTDDFDRIREAFWRLY